MTRTSSLTMGYSLGILKIGDSQIRNIMLQPSRVGQTDDTHGKGKKVKKPKEKSIHMYICTCKHAFF